jgi:hypothetical protein
MYVIRHQVPFQNTTFFLFGQATKYFAKVRPQLHIQRLATTLGDKRHMVFALPYGVA